MKNKVLNLTEKDKMMLIRVAILAGSAIILGLITFMLVAPNADFIKICCNLVIVSGLFGVSIVILHRFSTAFIFTNAVMLFFYYLNEYVYASRFTQVQFNDVYCIGDALKMSSSYPLIFTIDIFIRIFITAAICVGYVFIMRKFFKDYDSSPYWHNLLSGVIVTVLSLSILFTEKLPMDDVYFDVNTFTDSNGLFYSWYSQFTQSFVEKPNGYSAKSADEALGVYLSDDSADYEKVNVVVIMNEALADYSLIGDTQFNQDPLKNIHSMEENCISGRLAVNVYGGYTCNTEFEFLTGYSMAFLPHASLPYIQYINSKYESITSDMNTLGYDSVAVHPYLAQEWRRPYVYNHFGFRDFISGEDFSTLYKQEQYDNITNTSLVKVDFGSDLEYIRGFVSDRECYNKVYSILENNTKQDDNSFVFAITVQNHGGYNYDGEDFNPINFVDEKYHAENQYLTSSYYSDLAFKEFTEKLKSLPEKTVVLMFGDHQPGLANISKIIDSYSDEDNQYQKAAENYTVPYIMWANYDVEWKDRDDISINYLSAILKENAGLPLTDWDKFRLAAAEQFPVITANYALNKDGEYTSTAFLSDNKIIENYRIIQYRKMFDFS